MKDAALMSNEELRIEIAEFCGYKLGEAIGKTHAERKFWYYYNGKEWERASEINYPVSLDAMWEAEERLPNNEVIDRYFYIHLSYEIYKSATGGIKLKLFHATAKQRAIAFVKTIREIKR